MRAILEPSIEEYAFVTPRDAGSPFFAVSIKYRVNIYLPDGKLADSWGFTGYGTAPAQGLSSAPPLQTATALAMRDAGAKLAVEFREQATVRGLLPEGATADTLAKPAPSSPRASSPESCSPPIRPLRPRRPRTGESRSSRSGDDERTPDSSQTPEDDASQDAPAKDEPAKDEPPPENRQIARQLSGQRPPSTPSLRVRNTSRFVMPVVATGSPLTNLGRKRAARIAASASDAWRCVPFGFGDLRIRHVARIGHRELHFDESLVHLFGRQRRVARRQPTASGNRRAPGS